jgi:hypothetical protein
VESAALRVLTDIKKKCLGPDKVLGRLKIGHKKEEFSYIYAYIILLSEHLQEFF